MPKTEPKKKPISSLLQTLESFLQHQTKPMWIQDVDKQTFLAVNEAALTLSGYSRHEFLQKRVGEVLVEEIQLPSIPIPGIAESISDVRRIYRLLRKDGSYVNVELTLHQIRDENQSTALVFAQEITLHTSSNRLLRTFDRAAFKMEQALTPHEIFQAVAQELKKDGYICTLFLCDEQLQYLYPRHLSYDTKIIQLTEKLTGLDIEKFSIPLDATPHFHQVIREKKIIFLEDTQAIIRDWLPQGLKKLAGQISALIHSPKSILAPLNVEGKVIGSFSVTAPDLTVDDIPAVTAFASLIGAGWQRASLYALAQEEIARRQLAEQTLRQSEEKFRLLSESSLTGVYLIQDGVFRYVNQALASIFGYQVEEIINRLGPLDLTHPDDRQKVTENIRLRVDGFLTDIRYTFRGLRKDGSILHVEVHGRRIELGNQVGVIGTLLDVSERVVREQTLQQTEAQLRTIIEQVPAVIYTESAQDGRLLFISPQVETISGYTPQDWQSRSDFWKGIIHPEDREAVIKADEETKYNGEPFHQEYRIITRDGRIVWLYDDAVLIRDEKGQPLYWQGIMVDISQQKVHEREVEALAQLAQTLGKSLDLHSLLEQILATAIHAIPAAEKGTILLAEQNGHLKIHALQGYTDPHVLTTSFPLEKGYSARVFRQKQAQIIHDARADAEIRYDGEIVEIGTIQSAVVAPLIAHDEVIGVISLDNATRKGAFSEHDLHMLESFAATAALVIERARFYDEIARRSAHNTALNAILVAANRVSNDLDNLLEIVLDHLLSALGLTLGTIWLNEAHFGQHHLALRNVSPQLSQEMLRMSVEQHMDSKEVQVINQYLVDTDPLSKILIEKYGIQAAIVVPLLVEGKRIGGIAVASTQPQQWNEDEIRLLETLGRQLGLLIERVRWFEETQKNLTRLEAVYHISLSLRKAQNVEEALPLLLDETLTVMHTNAGSVMLYHPYNNTLKRMVARGWFSELSEEPQKLDEGIAGAVFSSGKSYVTNDFASDPMVNKPVAGRIPRGWGGVCVPIRTTTTSLGVIFVAVQQPRQITDDEVALLESLADIASSAIQRMSLYEETLRQVERLGALREIDRAITASFDLDIILDTLLRHMIKLLAVDAANILLYNPSTQLLERVAGQGFFTPLQSKLRLRLGESLAGRVALEQRSLFVPDLSAKLSELSQPELLEGQHFRAYCAYPMISKGQLKGVVEVFSRKPIIPDDDWMNFLETISGQLVIAIDNTHLFEDLQRSNFELSQAYDATIEGWSRALDMRDKETEGHTQRVTELVLQLAKEYGIKSSELVHIRRGAILHDIGKMAVPDRILLKNGPLSESEWEIMRRHPQYALE
ncbi:MAG: GAF domain-containing protein, partial [Anaerolineales bacterium]